MLSITTLLNRYRVTPTWTGRYTALTPCIKCEESKKRKELAALEASICRAEYSAGIIVPPVA